MGTPDLLPVGISPSPSHSSGTCCAAEPLLPAIARGASVGPGDAAGDSTGGVLGESCELTCLLVCIVCLLGFRSCGRATNKDQNRPHPATEVSDFFMVLDMVLVLPILVTSIDEAQCLSGVLDLTLPKKRLAGNPPNGNEHEERTALSAILGPEREHGAGARPCPSLLSH